MWYRNSGYPEQSEEAAVMIGIERLADVFVDVADTLVADFDVIEFLHGVAAHATEMTGAAAAGLMLADLDGGLHYMGASDESARLLELFQIQHQEGPCLDCYRTGEPVTEVDLAAAASRWPAFVAHALPTGVVAVHAFPMRLRDQVIGAVNVFGTEHRALDADESRVVQALADLATIAIIQERSIRHAELVTEQLQFALNSRVVIEQAKGAVARAQGVSVTEAFDLLRTHARRQRIGLTELAMAVVETPEGPQLLRGEP